jgi:hypothetical protein
VRAAPSALLPPFAAPGRYAPARVLGFFLAPTAWLELELFASGKLGQTLVLGGSIAVVLAVLAALCAVRLWSQRRTLVHRMGSTVLVSLALVLLTAGAYALWICMRPQPSTARFEVHPGIVVERSVRRERRPLVVHTATIDLGRPDLRIVTTPPPDGDELPARTTSAFAREQNLRLAINGQFFAPSRSQHPLDFYPAPGNPVRPVRLAASRGRIYVDGTRKRATLYVTHDDEVRIGLPPDEVRDALTGGVMLVADGSIHEGLGADELAPRTAIGLSRDRKTLILVVVDGRQPAYSEGASMKELATILFDAGAHDAFELDGGGSSTMVSGDGSGSARVLNCPIHTGLPCRERPVANHLGIESRSS